MVLLPFRRLRGSLFGRSRYCEYVLVLALFYLCLVLENLKLI